MSRPLKHDAAGGDKILSTTYILFADKTLDDKDFKQHCIGVIRAGVSDNNKKDAFVREINRASRLKALKSTQNYILAGMGLKV